MINQYRFHMKLLFLTLWMIAGIVCGSISQAAEPWSSVAEEVLHLADEMDGRTDSSARFLQQDRAALLARVEKLKSELSNHKNKLETTEQELTRVSALRSGLAEQYQKDMADMKIVEGIFRSSIQQSINRFEKSPVTALHPEMLVQLNDLKSGDVVLDLDDMRRYCALLFSDMKATAEMEIADAEMIGLDGEVRSLPLVRAGGFFLGYQAADDSVFALPQGNIPPRSVKSSGMSKKYLSAWLTGESEIVPLDITGGAAFQAIQAEKTVREWLEEGGVLLYPILLAGLIGAAVALFKTVHLLVQKRFSAKQLKRVFTLQLEGTDTVTFLQSIRCCPASRVLLSCLNSQERGLDAMDCTLEEQIIREQGRLERFISAVGVLASISPLLGLLGTVTGMIDTFQAITLYGTGDPRMMSTGISEALITTQAGLAIALPLLLAHHFLKRRVAALVANMEEAGQGMIAVLSSR